MADSRSEIRGPGWFVHRSHPRCCPRHGAWWSALASGASCEPSRAWPRPRRDASSWPTRRDLPFVQCRRVLEGSPLPLRARRPGPGAQTGRPAPPCWTSHGKSRPSAVLRAPPWWIVSYGEYVRKSLVVVQGCTLDRFYGKPGTFRTQVVGIFSLCISEIPHSS